MTDSLNITRLVQQIEPDEIYNLAAQSHVAVSFEQPEYTANTDATGTLRVLEAVRLLGLSKKTKIYQASTSELFGKVKETPQNENTPFHPRSPYAAAKVYAYWITVNYREAYGMFASNGILFNHESPLRGETFVTRKITRAVSRILLGLEKKLYLGNLSAKRDWGHAKDYVKGMWLILQQAEPDDYVFATGKTTEVRDFLRMSFSEAGFNIDFKGTGIDEKGIITGINEDKMAEALQKSKVMELEPVVKKAKDLIGRVIVEVDKKYFRPSEVDMLLGDYTKARTKLGWEPSYTLDKLVEEMVLNDIGINYKELILKNCGFEVPKSCGL